MNKLSYKQLVEKINKLEKKLLDIECIQGEKDLQESEKKYHSLIENIPDVIWVSDEFGNTTYISHNVEKIYGYTCKEIYDSGTDLWFGKIHPDDIDRVKKTYQLLFTDNKKFDIEYRIRKKDGNWLWLHDRALTKYERDNIQYAYGIYTDITERKQIEKALRESEERFQRLSEAASEGIIIIDGDKVIDANMKLAQIIGYELPEIIGKSGFEFLAPESRELVAKNILERYEFPYETIGLKKDGTYIHLEVSGKSIPYHGRTVRVSTIRDITQHKRAEKALRESEERYRAIFDTAAISIWEYDWKEAAVITEELKTRGITDYKKYLADHPDVIREIVSLIRLCDVNKETLRLYGAKNKEELMKQFGKHCLPETFELFSNVVIAYIEGKTYFESETVNETLDGRRINIIIRVSIPTSIQLLNRALVTVTDITGRKRLENQRYVLQQLREEVLKMTGMEDIQRVLQVLRKNLTIADIPFKDGCINVIKEFDEPPVIHSYALTREKGWIYSIPDKSKKNNYADMGRECAYLSERYHQ